MAAIGTGGVMLIVVSLVVTVFVATVVAILMKSKNKVDDHGTRRKHAAAPTERMSMLAGPPALRPQGHLGNAEPNSHAPTRCSPCESGGGGKATAPEPRWWGGERTCPASATYRSKEEGGFFCDVCFTTDKPTANLFKRGGGAAIGVVEATSPNPDVPVSYFLVDREPRCIETQWSNAMMVYVPESCVCQPAAQGAFPRVVAGDFDLNDEPTIAASCAASWGARATTSR